MTREAKRLNPWSASLPAPGMRASLSDRQRLFRNDWNFDGLALIHSGVDTPTHFDKYHKAYQDSEKYELEKDACSLQWKLWFANRLGDG
mmetsp:Transcript_36060/g.82819  ORF Transcript_36060/g.82819 Transcript_36060/m.82819 type:complete len:89 (+) Transcript_36060:164-430(+)